MNLTEMAVVEIRRLQGLERASHEGLIVMRGLADDSNLRRALDEEIARTQERGRRLERACGHKGWADGVVEPRSVETVRAEMREALAGQKDDAVRDVSLACLARKLAHLSVSSYETALVLSGRDGDLTRTLVLGAQEARKTEASLEWLLNSHLAPLARELAGDASPGETRA